VPGTDTYWIVVEGATTDVRINQPPRHQLASIFFSSAKESPYYSCCFTTAPLSPLAMICPLSPLAMICSSTFFYPSDLEPSV
jgi:hypothetical protein